jgi:antitoxin VapB
MKTAKLFQNGGSQAIRLPSEFRFEGNKVYLKKMGNMVVIIPEKNSFEKMWESLETVSDDFMVKRDSMEFVIREEIE